MSVKVVLVALLLQFLSHLTTASFCFHLYDKSGDGIPKAEMAVLLGDTVDISVYKYWSGRFGWVAAGFSDNPSTDFTIFMMFKERRNELYKGTLDSINDWSTLKLELQDPSIGFTSKTVRFEQSRNLGYSGITLPLKLVDDLPRNSYALIAYNSTQRFNSSFIITDSVFENEVERSNNCTKYSVEYRSTLYLYAPFALLATFMMCNVCIAFARALQMCCFYPFKEVKSRVPTVIVINLLIGLVNTTDILQMIFQILHSALEMRPLFYVGHVFWIISLAVFIIAFFGYMILLARYFYVRNLYSIISRSKGTSLQKLEKSIKFHRFVSSKTAVIIAISVFAVLVLALSALVGYLTADRGVSYRLDTNISRFVITAIIFLVELGALIMDLIFSWQTIRTKGIRYYFFFDDPLRFRLEMLFVFTIPVNSLIVMCLNLGYDSFTFTPNKYIQCLILLGFIALVNFFQFVIYDWTLGGGFALQIASCRCQIKLIKRILSCGAQHEVLVDEIPLAAIEEYLYDESNIPLFEEYTAREFSSENLMFRNALYKFVDRDIPIDTVREWSRLYVERNAALEVNLPGKVKREFLDRLENCKESTVPWDVVKPLYMATMYNLNDTFARFSSTIEYQQLMQSKKLQSELMSSTFHMSNK